MCEWEAYDEASWVSTDLGQSYPRMRRTGCVDVIKGSFFFVGIISATLIMAI